MSTATNLKLVIDKITSFKKELKRFGNSTTVDYINFIETVINWIEDLVNIRIWEEIKLSTDHWTKIEPLLFPKTLKLLNKGELSLQTMLQESVNLINKIIEIGTISATDFNLLQFNLARVYGKTSDMVIEQCRHNLLVKLTRQRAVVKQTHLSDSERDSLLSIPDAELGKLILSQTFQFTPSARTKSEHKLILNKHNNTLADQRNKLRTFSRRLHKAVQISRARTRVRVRLQVEKIRKEQKLRHERIKTDLSRRYGISISSSTSNNHSSASKQFKDATLKNNQVEHKILMPSYQKNLANRVIHRVNAIEKDIDQKKNEYISVREINEQFVHKKFNQEFFLAKNKIFNRKKDFFKEVSAVKKYYSTQNKMISDAPALLKNVQENFSNNKNAVSSNFTEKANKIKNLRDSAALEETKRSQTNKQISYSNNENLSREPFPLTTERLPSKDQANINLKEGDLAIFDSEGKQFVYNKNIIMMNEARSVKERSQSKMNFDKELFLLDVRFARYRLKNASKRFKNLTHSKNEEIKSKQRLMIARHRAKFKSKLIRNLLKSIKLIKQ